MEMFSKMNLMTTRNNTVAIGSPNFDINRLALDPSAEKKGRVQKATLKWLYGKLLRKINFQTVTITFERLQLQIGSEVIERILSHG
jgi:hypothetical protein